MPAAHTFVAAATRTFVPSDLRDLDVVVAEARHHGAQVDLDPHPVSSRAVIRDALAHGGQEPIPALDQDDAGRAGIDAPVVVLQGTPGKLLQLPRHLHAARPSTDHHEGHQGPTALLVVLLLRPLERPEDLPLSGRGRR